MVGCNNNLDCESWEVCSNLFCTHKSLADPTPTELGAWFLLPIFLGMINIGGQGGGLVKFPLLLLMFHYAMSEANIIQYLPVIGTSFCNGIFIIPQRNPDADTPLVEYDFLMTVFPGVVLGTSLGIFTNLISPDIVVSIGLLAALLVSTY
jgi:uncharacterized membrane protein YfcA